MGHTYHSYAGVGADDLGAPGSSDVSLYVAMTSGGGQLITNTSTLLQYDFGNGHTVTITGTGLSVGGTGGITWSTLTGINGFNSSIYDFDGLAAGGAPGLGGLYGVVMAPDAHHYVDPDTGEVHDAEYLGENGRNALYGIDGATGFFVGAGGADLMRGGNGNDTFRLYYGDFIAGEDIGGGGGNRDTIEVKLATNEGSTYDVDLSIGQISGVEILRYIPSIQGATFFGDRVTISAAQAFNAGQALAVQGSVSTFDNTTDVCADTLTIVGANGHNFSTMAFTDWQTGIDTVTIKAVGGVVGTIEDDIIDYTGAIRADSVNGWDGDDIIIIPSTISSMELIGGNGIDTLKLEAANLTLNLHSTQAPAVLTVERVVYDTGNSTLTDSAEDIALGGLQNITGSAGIDTLLINVDPTHHAGADLSGIVFTAWTDGTDIIRINGADFVDDTLIGSSQADIITGLTGNDTLTGGAGDDVLLPGQGTDTVDGGAGNDTVSFADVHPFGQSPQLTVDLRISGPQATGAGTDTLISIENVIGALNNDTLIGNSADNLLDGGAGADHMTGGAGSDIYYVDNTGDVVTENANEGTDEVRTSLASYTLGANLENLTGTASTGQTLTGNTGDNIIKGGSGADTMAGGAGNDTYVVDNPGDVVTENANEGTDTVEASVTYTLPTDVENLTLTGSGNLTGTGNASANLIAGNSGDNVINGAGGADTMAGGAGDDSYFVDNIGDVVTENANAGSSDTVYALVDYTLGANVENLVMQGSADLQGYGNGQSNALYGNSGNNTLDGGTGADLMAGGAGNDSYFVDNPGDVITENANEGSDIIYSTASLHLGADIENLVLQGSADLQGFGNAVPNAIYGNSGNNILDGDVGADLMVGGLGNDSYYVDNAGDVITENANEGTDTVYSTAHLRLTAGLENLILQGSTDLQGYGNGQSNAIYGNSGDNLLDGDAGADSMYGGVGNDTYYVDNIADVVVENANEGNDTVHTTANLVLAANCETLILDGSADLQGFGNGLDKAIYGNSGNNQLDGGAGGDSMYGGAGNDVYFVDNIADVIVENLNQGTDTVFSTANLVLGANVEQLVLQGSADLQGYGNSLVNALFGNSGNNVLDGGGGVDSLTGNAGNDTFVFHAGEAAGDTVIDFAGNGAAAGDALLFIGFGTAAQGATFTEIGATNQWQIHSGLDAHNETITFSNGATVHASDYNFI